MTSAELVFREGFAPNLSDAELTALADACRDDDPKLTQKSTTTPPPLQCVQDWPCEAGCGLVYPFVMLNGGFGAVTVGAAGKRFAELCFKADEALGEPAACRWFLNWFDEAPREEMRADLERWCRDVLAAPAGGRAVAVA